MLEFPFDGRFFFFDNVQIPFNVSGRLYRILGLTARKKFRSQNKTVQVDLKISRSFCNVKYHKQKLN